MPSLTITVHGVDRDAIISTIEDAVEEIKQDNQYTTGMGQSDGVAYSFSFADDDSSSTTVPAVPPIASSDGTPSTPPSSGLLA